MNDQGGKGATYFLQLNKGKQIFKCLKTAARLE